MKRKPITVFYKGKEIDLPPIDVKLRVTDPKGVLYNYDEQGRYLLNRGIIPTKLIKAEAYGPIDICGISFVLTKNSELPETLKGHTLNKRFRINEPLTGRRVGSDTVTAEEAIDNAELNIQETGVLFVKETIRVTHEALIFGVRMQPIDYFTVGFLL